MKMKNKVLAVLLLVLLMINMVPVKRAEAAESFDYARGYELSFADVSLIEDFIPVYYCVLTKDDYVTYLFFESIPSVTGQQYIYWANYGSTYLHYRVYKSDMRLERVNSGHLFYSFDEVSYCNFNVSNSSGEVFVSKFELPEPEPTYTYTYSSSGPVAATWSAGISNLMRFAPKEADDIEDIYVKNNWVPKYDTWDYRIIYRLTGELPALAATNPTDGSMYKLHTESVIALPSKEIVTGWISSGMSPVELYFDKNNMDWFQTVYDGKNTFVKVKVINESVPEYHSLMNGSHAFKVDIPMTDIIASVDESFDGGLRGYYGLSQEMWELWKNSVYSNVLPYEIYTVLYAKENAYSMVYGNMHYSVPNWTDIDPLTKGYVFNGGVIEKPLEDITDDDKQEIQIDTTRDELAKRTEELEQLRKEYEEALKLNGESEDLFSLFNGLSNGLRTSSNSFKGIATAVGNVFAFFPEEITSLLYAGFIALIVIAIYKALRG